MISKKTCKSYNFKNPKKINLLLIFTSQLIHYINSGVRNKRIKYKKGQSFSALTKTPVTTYQFCRKHNF